MDNFFTQPFFRLDQLNGFLIAAVFLFFILTLVYSWKFMKGRARLLEYYTYIILTAISSVGALLADNLIVLLACWGFLGLLLYLLINMGQDSPSYAAKKTLIIIGGADALMLLGVGIIYSATQTLRMGHIQLELNNPLLILAYLCIAAGCFAKAGAMPLHSWVPDCAQKAPLPVTAYLPASLDKLLGVYLLARISLNLFVMNKGMNIFLESIGALTILGGVMMALMQHNLKRLLGYHAVSQVGYMVLGIGTGNPIGIAGGLFHMLNNALYKSCLFFASGNVEYRKGTSELDELGGLSKAMPLTYISSLIASLAISGVPPFNGFVSKWLVYQGLVLRIQEAGSRMELFFSAFCLVAAMFGSALTLASFMKLLHAVFLGQRLDALKNKETKEVPWQMWAPCITLAVICVIFGIFAFVIPLKYFIIPAVSVYQPVNIAGLLAGRWSPVLATLLLIVGLLSGLVIFKLFKLKLTIRQDNVFTGGELTDADEKNMVTGIDFYNTVKEMPALSRIYKWAEKGIFDIYEEAKHLSFVSKTLQFLHNGVLPTYLVWMLLGMAALFIVFIK